MNSSYMKFLHTLAVTALVAASLAARADDTDIYVTANAGSDPPVVMFTLDYRSNLGSTACSGGACNFLLYTDWDNVSPSQPRTYTDATGTARPYLTLSGGTAAYFDLLRGALKYVIQQVGSSGVKIGFATNHENENNCAGPSQTGCSNGGYIIMGATAMTTQAARDAFFTKLDAMPVPGGSVAHSYQGKELFFELFRYFSGQGWYNMKNGWKDRGTNNTYNVNQADDYSPADATVPLSWDAGIVSGSNYVSPVTNSCTKLYTLNILFQVSQQENDSDSAITASSAAGGMGGINLSGSNNKFSTVVRWMYDYDNNTSFAEKQNVISYFIVDSSKVNTTTREYAGAGQGLSSAEPYTLSNDPQTLVGTLLSAFRNILSVSTTFVSPSVAVNVYNRSQVQSDVFIAMFQAKATPNWPGNLKKYMLATNATTGEQELQDVNSAFAVDAVSGRIAYSALSYWTITGDLPDPGTSLDIVDLKDGRKVDRGGAGSKIPGFKLKCASATDTGCYPGDYSPGLTNPAFDTNANNIGARKLFYDDTTNTGADNTGLRALNADVTTATALQTYLGAASVGTCAESESGDTACRLLMWARGVQYYDPDNNSITNNSVLRGRSWVLNDLLHSRPFAINYGARGSGSDYSTTNPDIRILTGSNDGFMHMLRNTKPNDTSNANDTDGVETWAFMPKEVMPIVQTLVTNDASTKHPYGVDGAPTAYLLDANGDGNIDPTSCATIAGSSYCDKVWLFFGLRRGGSAYYALDLTNPDEPKLMWKITNTTTGFTEMGQSWSTPKIGMMLFNGNTVSKPVLVFGGGYAPNKDTHAGHTGYSGTAIGTDDTVGNAVYIVDAQTGALVWKTVFDDSASTPSYDAANKTYKRKDMKDSIPSDATLVDSDGNGLIDRIYVGDTGGVLWRIDTWCPNQDGTTANCAVDGGAGVWKATPIFSAGRQKYGQTSLADDRRFFYAPAYVKTKDATGNLDAVIIGTGDRENPKDTTIVNWMYMIKDRSTSYTPPTTLLTPADLTDVTCVGSTSSTCNTVNANGWKLKLECPPAAPASCGEKNLSSPVALGDKVFFSTYIPKSTTTGCGLDEGKGLLYAVDLLTAAAVEDFDGTNNTGTQTLFRSDRYRELSSKGIPSEIVSLGGGGYLTPDLKKQDAGLPTGFRSYWYTKEK